ncbi:hypothetical protein EV361DRAFT_885321 [Lentinula raphanica]|nr:hypothetical protein EV361DRAFT_885321 [Lentinula raphanica]
MDKPIQNIQDLPLDIAGEIFSHLQSPADLLHVAQASKSVYFVAIRLLYRNIRYDTVNQFSCNLSFWNNGTIPNIVDVPRSVVIGRHFGQSLCPENTMTFLSSSPDAYDSSDDDFLPTLPQLRKLLLSFPKLEKLVFQQVRINSDVHHLLGQLSPTLRVLAFENCSFIINSYGVDASNLSNLNVKQLCITGNHPGRSTGMHSQPFNLVHLPAGFSDSLPVHLDMYSILIRSPRVESLCLEWNVACAGRFSRNHRVPTPAFANLKHLEVRFGMRNHAMWNAESNSGETKMFLMTTFARLLAPCNRLTELVLFGYIPGLGGRSDKPVLPALRSYTGPIDFLKSSLRHCTLIEKLIFPDAIKDIDAAMLQALPYNASQSVQHFEISVERWDLEVLYAVSMELPSLQVLKIKYEYGYPDEDMLISFGPEFLSRLPSIDVFHLYRPDDDVDDLRGLGIYSHLSKFTNPPLNHPREYVIPKTRTSYKPNDSRRRKQITTDVDSDDDTESDTTLPSTSHATTLARKRNCRSAVSRQNRSTSYNSTMGAGSSLQGSSANTTGPPRLFANWNTSLASDNFPSSVPNDLASTSFPFEPLSSTSCNHRPIRMLPKPSVPDLGPCGRPDAHENLASWEKYTPELREVRLVDAFVWRRAGVGDPWCKRELREDPAKDGARDAYCRFCGKGVRFMNEDDEDPFIF